MTITPTEPLNCIRFCIYGKNFALEFKDETKTKSIILSLNAELKRLQGQIICDETIGVLTKNMTNKYECAIIPLD